MTRSTRPSRSWPSRHVLGALVFGTAGLGLGLAASCGEGDTLRREVLTHLTDEVIVPAQDQLHTDAEALAAAVRAACAGGGASPTDAWKRTRVAWGVTGAFMFGPVTEQMQAGPLDFWPVRPDTIEAKIAGAPASIDAAYIDLLGTSAKGLPALEYLLFTDPLMPGTPRCAYAEALALDIAARTGEIADGWHTGHAEALRSAGHGSEVYGDEQAGVDAIVNATIENLYRMVKDKLDRPLGNLTGSEPDPAILESIYSHHTRADLEANLDGFTRVYLGADREPGGDPGLGALVAARDATLDDRILAQLDVARGALAAIPGELAEALTADRSAVQSARDELDALRRFIKLDVASLLGVTLMISDNDGD